LTAACCPHSSLQQHDVREKEKDQLFLYVIAAEAVDISFGALAAIFGMLLR
jgi:hypothetical protein